MKNYLIFIFIIVILLPLSAFKPKNRHNNEEEVKKYFMKIAKDK